MYCYAIILLNVLLYSTWILLMLHSYCRDSLYDDWISRLNHIERHPLDRAVLIVKCITCICALIAFILVNKQIVFIVIPSWENNSNKRPAAYMPATVMPTTINTTQMCNQYHTNAYILCRVASIHSLLERCCCEIIT